MEIDKTTLSDLVIFDREDEFSIFNKINFTVTSRGKEQLRRNLMTPLTTIEAISGIQQTLLCILKYKKSWPAVITNGTLMVVERLYESQIDPIPASPGAVAAFSYKLLHGHDFSLIKYSVKHCFDFIAGLQQLVSAIPVKEAPKPLGNELLQIQNILHKEPLQIILKNKQAGDLNAAEMLALAHFILYGFKNNMLQLLAGFAKLDAWYGMALAVHNFNLTMPVFNTAALPMVNATGLYHIMLQEPVPYSVRMDRDTNFIFLTGANMAGKSTFIRACGTAVYLAHTGMGVPAKNMELTYFDGILSNINVIDNIAKGESYFFNEVQRIKSTISKISDGKKWLILIDELFKGTNVQDAMKCSSTVIEGLLKIKNSLFILSTHLYEIGEELKKHPNISFNYFETTIAGDELNFSYQLKNGVSNDRLGYLILKKEGVVSMLQQL